MTRIIKSCSVVSSADSVGSQLVCHWHTFTPDGGKIIITSAWGEKTELACRYIDETHTEVGSNLLHICEFAERMEKNGATYEPKTEETPQAQKAAKHKDHER